MGKGSVFFLSSLPATWQASLIHVLMPSFGSTYAWSNTQTPTNTNNSNPVFILSSLN